MANGIVFKTTPLYRLTATYDEDLDKLADPNLDEKLADQLVQRLAEAQSRRDNNLRALVIVDALLAVVISGKNLIIPGLGISTQDLPAAIEVLVAVSTFALLATAVGFTTWLCYSQLLWTVKQRAARKADIAGGIFTDSEHFNEMSVRLLQRSIANAGTELFSPMRGFTVLIFVFEFCYKIVFGLVPFLHLSLIGYGFMLIFERSGVDPLRGLLFTIVLLGHVLATIIWFSPSIEFRFKLRRGEYTRGDSQPSSRTTSRPDEQGF